MQAAFPDFKTKHVCPAGQGTALQGPVCDITSWNSKNVDQHPENVLKHSTSTVVGLGYFDDSFPRNKIVSTTYKLVSTRFVPTK
jgi:hypothetical protein